jgi:hypothetical protein
MKKIVFSIAVLSGIIFWGNLGEISAQAGRMEWRGTVDDVVQIRIRNRRANVRTVSGTAYYDDNASFSDPLPRRRVTVSVDKRDGRGEVFVVQQPNARNNFTAIVQIVDKKGSRDRYRFILTWY